METSIYSAAHGGTDVGDGALAKIVRVAVPLTGIALSIAGALAVRQWQVDHQAGAFSIASGEQVGEFRRELDAHFEVLHSLGALYDSSNNVERAEFATFVRGALDRHQSIKALLWIEPVSQTERAAFEAAARADGLAGFSIVERGPDGNPVPAPERLEYLVTRFGATHENDAPLLGFNQSSEPVRAEALARARAAREVVVSAAMPLDFPAGRELGVVAYMPVYKAARPASADVPRSETPIQGFVAATFSVGESLRDALSDIPASGIAIRITDESSAADRLLGQYAPDTGPGSSQAGAPVTAGRPIEYTAAFDVGGRRWRATCTPLPGFFVPGPWWEPWGVLTFGLVITGLVTLNIWKGVSSRRDRDLVEEDAAGLRRINHDMGVELAASQHEMERRNLLIRAMDERVRQSLAAVVTVVQDTADNSVSLQDFSQKFRARIGAMSRLHSALAESRWDGTDLGTLVRQTLESYTADTPGRVVVRGEALTLPADAVSGVSMALHELATNAAHFGALSVPEGRVEVAWVREKGEDGGPVLRLVWTEGGGPTDVEQTPAPSFTGVGRPRLDIPGRANLQFVEGGVRCELVVPLGAPAH